MAFSTFVHLPWLLELFDSDVERLSSNKRPAIAMNSGCKGLKCWSWSDESKVILKRSTWPDPERLKIFKFLFYFPGPRSMSRVNVGKSKVPQLDRFIFRGPSGGRPQGHQRPLTAFGLECKATIFMAGVHQMELATEPQYQWLEWRPFSLFSHFAEWVGSIFLGRWSLVWNSESSWEGCYTFLIEFPPQQTGFLCDNIFLCRQADLGFQSRE